MDIVSTKDRQPVGRPRRLSSEQIVAAARSLDPSKVTMRAVADVLGVDPKALNYHVSHKGALLTLLATDSLATHFVDLTFERDVSWQDAASSFARAMREAMIASGVAARAFRLTSGDARVLRPVEAVLQRFIAAGASVTLAGRLMTTLANLATSSALDVLDTEAGRVSPQLEEVAAALGGSEPGAFPVLGAMVERRISAADDEQFEIDLKVFLAGAATLLRQGHLPVPG